MYRRTFVSTTLISALLLTSFEVSACGESLFRVGKGMSYREFTAPLPGKILIVAKTDGELALAQLLAKSGHEISIISEPEQIGDELANDEFDIVLAHFTQIQNLDQASFKDSSAVFLPVASADSREEKKLAKAINRYAPSTDDSLKSFGKAIHRTLRSAEV